MHGEWRMAYDSSNMYQITKYVQYMSAKLHYSPLHGSILLYRIIQHGASTEWVDETDVMGVNPLPDSLALKYVPVCPHYFGSTLAYTLVVSIGNGMNTNNIMLNIVSNSALVLGQISQLTMFQICKNYQLKGLTFEIL